MGVNNPVTGFLFMLVLSISKKQILSSRTQGEREARQELVSLQKEEKLPSKVSCKQHKLENIELDHHTFWGIYAII